MAASEMASKMATAACGEVLTPVTAVARYIDEQLQEVRTVLTRLALRTNVDHIGHCWCYKNLTNNSEPHDKDCLAARTLWQRLQPITTDEHSYSQV